MEVVINGKTFPTLKAAAASIGISPQSLSRRIQLGLTGEALETKEQKYNTTVLMINGILYSSIKQAAEAYGVESRAIQRWIKQKRFNATVVQQSIFKPGHSAPKPVIVNGERYKSVGAAAKALDVPLSTLAKRITKANEHPEAEVAEITFDPARDYREKAVVIEGKKYSTIKEAAEVLGVNYQTLVSRINSGYYEKQAQKRKGHK